MNAKESDLYKIEVSSSNPFDLFKEWQEKATTKSVPITNMFNFATSDGCGRVSARSLMLRQLDEDGFVFMTDGRSKKSFDLSCNSFACMTFMWVIPTTMEWLQIRIEGKVKREETQKYLHLYKQEPLFCKIRTAIQRQGEMVDWDTLKEEHDEMYEMSQDINSDLHLDVPPLHAAVFKLYPTMMDFYACQGVAIADRIIFRISDDPFIPKQMLENTNDDTTENNIGKEYVFNNGHKIQIGVSDTTMELKKQDWIYYHVSS